jgi:hypothetical protein
MVSLTNGQKFMVLESGDEIIRRVIAFRRQITARGPAYGDGQIALTAGLAIEHRIQLELPEGADNGGDMAVGTPISSRYFFAFFVVMGASSQADQGKAQQVSDSVNKALEGDHMPAVLAAILGGTVGDKEEETPSNMVPAAA